MTGGGMGYEIGRMTHRCAATDRPLTPGEPFVAALFEQAGSELLERRDYSLEAWEGSAKPKHVFAHWQGVTPSPDAKPARLIDDEELVSLFESLDGAEDAKRQAFRFVLALILARKRLLVDAGRKSSVDGSPSVMLVRKKGALPGEPPIEVEDPGLDASTIAEVTEQVASLIRSAS